MDWDKFQQYRPKVEKSIRGIFSNIQENNLDDLFSDAYLNAFPKFEKKYDPEKGTVTSFLTKITKNEILNKLRREVKRIDKASAFEPQIDNFNNESYNTSGVETIYGKLTNRFLQRGINDSLDVENENDLKKIKRMRTRIVENEKALLRSEAWNTKEPLKEKHIENFKNKQHADLKSFRYFKTLEPLSALRLKIWMLTPLEK